MKSLSFLCALSISFFSFNCLAAFEKGHELSQLVLEGENGGHLDGSAWDSESMKGKISILFYVDPDEKDKNDEFSEALKERSFSREYAQFYAIINMNATWLPNFAISSSLKSKQKKYPDTVYLKDFKKVGVLKWEVADDENNVLILDTEGRVIFSKFGKLNKEEIQKALSLIENEIDKLQEMES